MPETLNLLTSNPTVLIPTVTIPAETGVAVMGDVKFTVPAVPTVEPSSFITLQNLMQQHQLILNHHQSILLR